MKSAALDLDFDIDIEPFDWSLVEPSRNGAGSVRAREPELTDLQHWYDLGFVGVVQGRRPYSDGYESTTTCELLAFWMGERDAVTRTPRQTLV